MLNGAGGTQGGRLQLSLACLNKEEEFQEHVKEAFFREGDVHFELFPSTTKSIESFCSLLAAEASLRERPIKVLVPADAHYAWTNVLAKYENGAALPPPAAPLSVERMNGRGGGSAPVAIGGGSSAHWRGRNGAMESDDDTSLPLSRSWDDCEVARSILNLNSPNGFHPLAGNGTMPPPAAFELGGGTGGAPQSVSGFAGGSLLGGGRPPTASSYRC